MRYLYLFLCLLLTAPCFAVTDTLEGQELTTSANIEGVTTTDTIEGQEIASAAFCDSSTADSCEDFDTGDTADVAGNTNFDSETDASNKVDIYSNEMRFYADTNGVTGDARETDCFSSNTEVTVKFILRLDDIVDIDNQENTIWILRLRDSDSQVAKLVLVTDAGGDLVSYRCEGNDGAETSAEITMTGVAADTDYAAYLYYKEDASVGEVACKIGSWTEGSTGAYDNSADDGIAFASIGGWFTAWGDGGTDTHIIFDDFEIFFSDQMP